MKVAVALAIVAGVCGAELFAYDKAYKHSDIDLKENIVSKTGSDPDYLTASVIPSLKRTTVEGSTDIEEMKRNTYYFTTRVTKKGLGKSYFGFSRRQASY